MKQVARLDGASAIELGFPHAVLASDYLHKQTSGDMMIETDRRRDELLAGAADLDRTCPMKHPPPGSP